MKKIILTILICLPFISQAQSYKKSMMWGCIGVEGSIMDKCKAVKAAGFDAVELNSHLDRKEVLAALKETGLKASSVCNSKHWEYSFSSDNEAERQKGIEAMIVAMEDAKAYGTDAVLLVPGNVSDTRSYDQCWDRSTECIKKLVPIAEKLGVKICIENVWNSFLLSPLEMARYIDQFGSKNVGSYFDVGNILVIGWPEQWIRILGDRVIRIHIKEFSNKIAGESGKWKGFDSPLLEGDNNWHEIMSAIKDTGYKSYLTIEHHGGETQEGLKDLNKRLDTIIKK